jgi:type II secretory pathway predicted ATPase ExeA/septal ring-binding cell division protein DamX
MNTSIRLPDPFDVEDTSGAQSDPFHTRYDDACYFDEAVRAKRLNLLFHLIPYSDVLLVTGESGSGKTCVLRRLLAGANDGWRICRVQATAEIDGARLLEIVYKEYSLRPDASEDADQRLRLLRESLFALRHNALVPVLVIDDAHLLTQPVLAMLGALTEPWESRDKLLSVVLFGEPEIAKRLIAPGLEALRARVSHTFDIPPLSEEETGKYIRHRLQAAGLSAAGPFTTSVIKFIHVASRGFPGRINEFARVVLHNSEQKGARPAAPASLGSRAKVYFKYGIAALLASAAAVGLLYQDRLMGLAGRTRDTAPAVAVSPAAVALAPADDTIQPLTEPPASDAASVAAAAVATLDARMDLTVPAEPASDLAPPSEIAVSAETETPAAADQAGTAIPATPAAVVAALTETPASVPEAGPDLDTAEVETAQDTVSVPDAAAAGPRDDDWLLAQDPNAYTLQLLVASRAQCQAYIERHGLGDAAALYQTRSSGQVWTSLVYGIYATEVDAADAGKAISEQDVNIKPWVRKVALVQSRIQEFRAGITTTTAPSPAPASQAINNGVAVPSGAIRRESWLLEQSPEAYTLQLVSGKEANVMAYLERHALSDKVALYQPPDGAGRLTVTYGIYPGRAEAVQAAKDLAAQLPDLKPWARSLREIQTVISPGQGVEITAPVLLSPQNNQ